MRGLRELLGRGAPRGEASAPAPPPRPPVQAEEAGEVLERYVVPRGAPREAAAEIRVVRRGGVGRCLVRLPPLDQGELGALALLKADLLSSIPADASGEQERVIDAYVARTAEAAGILPLVKEKHDKLLYYLLREFSGFWEVDPLIADDAIEEISVTRFDRPARVLHRGFSELGFMETDVVYPSEERLQAFIRRLAQLGGTTVSLAQPSLEVTLHGPSDRRVTATLGDEISRPGSTYAIRKQKERPLTLTQLAAPETPRRAAGAPLLPSGPAEAYEETPTHKTLSVLMAAYFWLLLERTTTVLVAGETNSGKTTLMNAILALTDPRAKIVTAEDVLEISLPDHLHWQRLKTRAHRAGLSPASSRYEYGLSDLLKLALRFSPTVLSLGEMRGEESETVAAAITLGFSTMTTVHAENAERCIQRLTTPPMRFAEGHVRDITAIATMRKTALSDGRVARRMVSVDEVKPVGPGGHEIVNIFSYDRAADAFSPTTAAEVVDRSYHLDQIGRTFGWAPARVQASLEARAAALSGQVAAGGFSPESLSEMVRRFSEDDAARGPGAQ